MKREKTTTGLQGYISNWVNCIPGLLDSGSREYRVWERFYPLALAQVRKWFVNKLNPFNLRPYSAVFWFLIPPFKAIGISILGLREIAVFWRQQLEPNETVFVLFKLFQFTLPFPLTLLVAFYGLGLVVVDGANRLVEASRMETEEEQQRVDAVIDELSPAVINIPEKIAATLKEEQQQRLLQLLNPFNLTPRMSIYFPVYDNHTTLGVLLMDFRHVEISLKQVLEPNETVQSLIRFFDLYAPFPLPILVMLSGFGLLLTGKIYDIIQETREEIIREVKRARGR